MANIFPASKIFSMEEAIDLCMTSNYGFLKSILRVIVAKLHLKRGVFVIQQGSEYEEMPIVKFFENTDLYKSGKSGSILPVQAKSVEIPRKVTILDTPWRETKKLLMNKSRRASSFIRRTDDQQEASEAKISEIEKVLKAASQKLEKLEIDHVNLEKRFGFELKTSFDIVPPTKFSVSTAARGSRSSSINKKFFLRDISIVHRACKEEFLETKKRLQEDVCQLVKKISNINEVVSTFKDSIEQTEKMKNYLDKIAPMDYVNSINKKVDNMCDWVSKCEKNIGKINSRVRSIIKCAEYTETRLKDTQKRINNFHEFNRTIENIERFETWKNKVENDLSGLTETIEDLRIIKADREEIDYISNIKADKILLSDLVSEEFFRSVQEDIMGGIVQILEQIMKDEIEWEKVHKDMQDMLDIKAHLCDVAALKKLMNCKMEILQKKINEIFRNNLTAQSAAVRTHILTDARCLSCTTQADISALSASVPLLESVAPRNVKCICEPKTRYCGGSHTLLAPDQKLILQQKPLFKTTNVNVLNIELTEGDDGQLYRTRAPKCICTTSRENEKLKEVEDDEIC